MKNCNKLMAMVACAIMLVSSSASMADQPSAKTPSDPSSKNTPADQSSEATPVDSTTAAPPADPQEAATQMDTDPQVTVDTGTQAIDEAPATPPAVTQDPYEKFNRAMFSFNDFVDKYLMKPIAKTYNVIIPQPLTHGIHNMYNNVMNFPTIANDLLQLNFYQATKDTWRLGINSTIGIAGFFDVATRIHLPQYSNDFGMTLATYGYKTSNYLVLPFFGPSSIRDGVGLPVDYFAFSIYPYIHPMSARYQVYGVGVVDRRAQLLKFEAVMEEAALDRYTFVRNAYTQRRTYEINQNQQLSFSDQKTAQNELNDQPVSSTDQTAHQADTDEQAASPAEQKAPQADKDNHPVKTDTENVSTPPA